MTGPASPAPPGSPGDTVPDQVLGQENFGVANINFVDGRSLGGPDAVAIDLSANPNHVYILDASNNRVLGWKSLSEFTGNQPADLVVGQPDFFGTGCNQLQTLGSFTPTAQTFCLNNQSSQGVHSGIAVDKHGNLFVADQQNSRVLEFSNPFVTMASSGHSSAFTASAVFGQNGSFSTAACNLVSQPGPLSPSQGSLCAPAGVAFDPAGNLYVADAGNSRALEFTPDASGSFGATPTPNTVFGEGGSYTTAICANGAGGNPALAPGTYAGFCPLPTAGMCTPPSWVLGPIPLATYTSRTPGTTVSSSLRQLRRGLSAAIRPRVWFSGKAPAEPTSRPISAASARPACAVPRRSPPIRRGIFTSSTRTLAFSNMTKTPCPRPT